MDFFKDRQKDSGYYDTVMTSPEYCKHYQDSQYYSFWQMVSTLLSQTERVIDIGCGPGQFAAFCLDNGIQYAAGVDFSRKAVELAKATNPDHADKFHIACGANPNTWTNLPEYDTVICLETLEHVTTDLRIMELIPQGKRIIFSVPNYPDPSHVRVFKNIPDVIARYGAYIKDIAATKYLFGKNVIAGQNVSTIFLIDCVKA